ncbi:caspase, EACC1-associated type [Streptomyces sp. NPDC003832]
MTPSTGGKQGLPDPQGSRAVLIGASRFRGGLDDLPAVRNGVTTLEGMLTGSLWGLPREHCVTMVDSADMSAVGRAIQVAAEAATDTLVVYYSGHGILDDELRLHLAVSTTTGSPMRAHIDAVPYAWVRKAVDNCRAPRRIVILDCCYSGAAMGTQSADLMGIAGIDGTFILAAAGPTDVAVSPPGEDYTAFTGALVELLGAGVEHGPEILDLSTVALHLRTRLLKARRPESRSLDRDSVGRLPFAVNAAHTPYPAVRVDELIEALHRSAQAGGDEKEICRTALDGVVTDLGYGYARIHLADQDGRLVPHSDHGAPLDDAPADLMVGLASELSGLRQEGRRVLADLPGRDKGPLGALEVHVPTHRALPGADRLADLTRYAFQVAVALTHVRVLAEIQDALEQSRAEVATLKALDDEKVEDRGGSVRDADAMRLRIGQLRDSVRETEQLWEESQTAAPDRLVAAQDELAARDDELSRLIEEFGQSYEPAERPTDTDEAADTDTVPSPPGVPLPAPPPVRATPEKAPDPAVRRPASVQAARTSPRRAGSGRMRNVLFGTGILATAALMVGAVVAFLPLSLTYVSGDKPKEVIECGSSGGEAVCETTEHQWRVPAGGKVRTVFAFGAGKFTRELRGTMALRGDCAARVRWSVSVDGRTVDAGTLSEPGQGQAPNGDLPSDASRLTVTAERTDKASCTADLGWGGF